MSDLSHAVSYGCHLFSREEAKGLCICNLPLVFVLFVKCFPPSSFSFFLPEQCSEADLTCKEGAIRTNLQPQVKITMYLSQNV